MFYYFAGTDWTVNDDDGCFKIAAPLGALVPNLTSPVSIDAFTASLQSYGFSANYEIQNGAGTASYIADRYAVVGFGAQRDGVQPGENGGSFGCALEIELPDGDMVAPTSRTWLKATAG